MYVIFKQEVCKIFQNESFLIHAVTTCEKTNNTVVYILFKEHATEKDILRAHILAFLVRTSLWKLGCRGNDNNNIKKFIQRNNNKNKDEHRISRLDIVSKIIEFDREIKVNNGNDNILDELTTKLLTDDDWKISSTMLETRYARLC